MTIEWKIETLDTSFKDDNIDIISVNAHWRCIGDNDGESYSIYGSCRISKEYSSFEFHSLKENEILELCFENIDKTEIENGIIAQIESIQKNKIKNSVLPWS